jgi:hypothetical protein
MIPVLSYCGFLGAPASHQANGAAICLDVRLLDATGQSLLVGHFSLRALVSACSLQPTMFTHCSLPFSFEERAPWHAAHLIQSPLIRPFPHHLSFTVGPRPELPYPCALSLWGLLALDVSHASRRVTSCFQILEDIMFP